MQKIFNFIGGELVETQSKEVLLNYNPSLGKVYSQIPDSAEADVSRAVDAASYAFPKWSATPAVERANFLRKIAAKILELKQELAEAESIDNGKPISVSSSVDIPRSAVNFEFFADAITQFSSECHVTDNSALNYTLRQPLGVVGCISPWNLPLYLLTWKIAPALAAGNTVVAKPSEVTPMTAFLLSKICIEVGLPPGVLNIVHGLGSKAGSALVANSKVKAVSFTGSTRTGSQIAQVAAGQLKKFSLELGGKNPNIIFADCNFNEALETTIRSSFANQGQICLCGSRIYVESSIYENFKQALVEKTRSLRIGNPLHPQTDQGALVSKEHFDKVCSYVDLAISEGGKILTGGKKPALEGELSQGWFFEPTLIENLGHKCRTNQEEIFGPVATIAPFENEAEVLDWANSTPYGLSASIWTQNISRAHRLAAQLQAGVVWINSWMLRDLRTPFGGTKQSGLGREGGLEALRFFTEMKNVCLKI